VVKSDVMARVPPTRAVMPVAAATGGITSPRIRTRSSSVSAACGEVVGMTWTAVTAESAAIGNGMATATPGSALNAPASWATAALSPGFAVSTDTMNGPFRPGPKPSARRS
jgi:hypothetical protein